MISRLTLSAAVFAILATASVSFAAQLRDGTATTPVATAQRMEVIQLPAVTVIGHRIR